MGGTHQSNDYNTNVDSDDTKFIYNGCIEMDATIKHAEIMKEAVGLRPGRTSARLERDSFTTSKQMLQIR